MLPLEFSSGVPFIMKKIYRILLIFTLVSLFFTTYMVIKEIFSLSLPNVKETIVIEDATGSKNTKELYQEIQKYVQIKGIDIHKIVFQIGEDGTPHKNIFTFSAKGKSDYFYPALPSDDQTNFYDASQLTTEDLFGGFYALTKRAPETIVEDFQKMGMFIQHESVGVIRYLVLGIFLKTGKFFIVLFLCTITALLFYKFSQRKKVGILQMLGQSPTRLILTDTAFDIGVLLSVLLIFTLLYPVLLPVFLWLSVGTCIVLLFMNIVFSVFAYNIGTISEKIKGRKPYKKLNVFNLFVKAAIFAFIVMNTDALITQEVETRQLVEQLSIWERIPDYYYLEFSNATSLVADYTNPDKEEIIKQSANINKRLLPLLEQSESSGGLLVNNNERVKSDDGMYTFSFLTVNHNYLAAVGLLAADGKPIKRLDKNSFYVLIPENEKENKQKIIEIAEKEIMFYQNFYGDDSEGYRGGLTVLYTQSDQQVFNYNHEWPKFSVSTNPIVLVVNLSLIQPNTDVWIMDISSGKYLFKDAKEVQTFIEENQMEKDFFGLTAVKDRMYHELQQMKSDYFITWLLLLLLILSFIAIELYITLVYFETNKKKLFLRFIFGEHFFSRYASFYFSVLGISMTVGTILLIWQSKWWLHVLFFLVLELVLLMLTTGITEKRMRVEVVKND